MILDKNLLTDLGIQSDKVNSPIVSHTDGDRIEHAIIIKDIISFLDTYIETKDYTLTENINCVNDNIISQFKYK